jgi:hypothetical protein
MTIRNLTLGLILTTSFFGFSQEETEQERECKRARFLAGEALKVKNYHEATAFYIKGEKICGGYEKDNYDRLVGALQYTINEETDAAKKSLYIDTLLSYYDKTEKLGFLDKGSSLTRGLYELQASVQNNVKIDKLLKQGIEEAGLTINEAYVQYYYQNIYIMYANSTVAAEKTLYKKRIISEYFSLSRLVSDAKMSAKTQENLRQFFNNVINNCADLLPELKGFMSSLPQDVEMKKAAVNNFISLLEEMKCTESKEYEILIDTLISVDKSIGTVIAKGKLLKAKKRYTDAIATFNDAKGMSTDNVQKEELEYEVLVIQYENLNSYKAAYNTAMGISGNKKSDALKIAASCVMKLANSCGSSTFDRKCNYYYAEDLANRAGASGLASQARGNAPSSSEIFDAGKTKGDSISLSCWGVSVTLK